MTSAIPAEINDMLWVFLSLPTPRELSGRGEMRHITTFSVRSCIANEFSGLERSRCSLSRHRLSSCEDVLLGAWTVFNVVFPSLLPFLPPRFFANVLSEGRGRASDSLWISAMVFLVNVFFATNGVSLAAFSFPFST